MKSNSISFQLYEIRIDFAPGPAVLPNTMLSSQNSFKNYVAHICITNVEHRLEPPKKSLKIRTWQRTQDSVLCVDMPNEIWVNSCPFTW